MNQLKLALFSVILCVTTITAKADLRDQINVQTGKAELIIVGMAPNEVASNVKDAITQFAIPSNLNFRSLPDVNPERPDRPEIKQIFVRGAPVVEYQCPTAYAEITKSPPPVSNAFAFVREYLQICLYSFQKGTKAYLIFTRAKKTESLTAGLFNGITAAIQGTDAERITKQLQENITDIRKKIPTLLVERVEIPGMPIQEPDKEAVSMLIPVKSVTSPKQLSNSVVDAPAQPIVSSSLNSSQQNKIEARKSLTAMGMIYHSQEQFFGAIRRKDDVAVQQFLEADGIDLASKDLRGKTPLEAATEVGASDVVLLIRAILEKKASPAASVAKHVEVLPSPSQSTPSASSLNTPKSNTYVSKDWSADNLTELNVAIDALDMPPEQKELMRNKAIRQLELIKEFSKNIELNRGKLE